MRAEDRPADVWALTLSLERALAAQGDEQFGSIAADNSRLRWMGSFPDECSMNISVGLEAHTARDAVDLLLDTLERIEAGRWTAKLVRMELVEAGS
ncbi:MAG: hypothetical protein JWN62_1214 [Acidimicrobiales bacterium]|nr:hypothetical protein [Acidimicrobiales bacterium]